MTRVDLDRRAQVLELAAIHAVTWLAIANAVGLLLALLLLAPGLGDALEPLGYGRWMPLHLDLQLYGWSSLPLVAVLLRLYLPSDTPPRGPALALGAWSGALGYGAVTWLAGGSSGKPFLDWRGEARALFAAAMLVLAGVLAAGWTRSARRSQARASGAARLAFAAKGALLLGLFVVPFVLYWAASPRVHPPINPETSGPTGVSLLGSTLAIVALMGAAPLLAGLRPRLGSSPRGSVLALAALLAHAALFAALDHGDRPHHDVLQIVAVGSLLPWVLLLDRHLRSLAWPDGSAPWLRAFRVWWTLLVSSAAITFLPGVLDRVKFTNVLVAHAHVAMAGAVTSFVVLLLCAVLRDTALRHLFRDRRAFGLWHGGNLAMVASLAVVGALEATAPGSLFGPDAAVQVLYAARALAGAAMLAASVRWLGTAWARSRLPARVAAGERQSSIMSASTPPSVATVAVVSEGAQ